MKPTRRIDYALISGLLMVLSIGALVGWRIYDDYRLTLSNAEALLSSLARATDEQLTGRLRAIDLFLRDIADEAVQAGSGDKKALEKYMRARTSFLPEVRTVLVTDPGGIIVATTIDENRGFDASGRPYYLTHKNASDPSSLFVSPPFTTNTGVVVILVSRAIRDAAGSFLGVVAVSLLPEYFEDLLRTVMPDHDGSVTIVAEGNYILARVPDPEKYRGFSLATAPGVRNHLASGQRETRFKSVSVADQRERVAIFRTTGLPAYVVFVSQAVEPLLAPWAARSMHQALAFVIVSSVTLFLIHLARRRLWQTEQAQIRLSEVLELNQGLISRSPMGIIAYRRDGPCLLANQAAADILGTAVPELLGQSYQEAAFWRTQGLLDAAASALDSGEAQEREIHFVTRMGREVWIACQLVRFPSGGDPHLLLLLIDMTERRRAEEELRLSRQRLSSIVTSMAEGVVLQVAEGRVELCNPSALEILGVSESELLGSSARDPRWRAVREDGTSLPGREHPVIVTLREGRAMRGVVLGMSKPGGETAWVSVNTQPLFQPGESKPSGVVSSFTDITERLRSEEQLKLAGKVFEKTIEGVIVADSEAKIRMVNPAFTEITGYSQEEVLGSDAYIFRVAEFDPAFQEQVWDDLTRKGQWSGEVQSRRKDGQFYPEWLTLSVLRDSLGRATNYIAVFHDITEIRRGEEKIKHQAYHDALTGLPNRLLFDDRLDQEIHRAHRGDWHLAVLFLDLDQFKHINDSLGHALGDALLQGVANRLTDCLREADTVARQGGDEFVIILPELDGVGGAVNAAQRIISALSQPFNLRGHELFVTASLGITLYPEDGQDRETLVKNADLAMYRAKEEGRNNYQLFTPEMNAKVLQRLSLEHRLRKALEADEFRVHYQPKVELAGGAVIGVEALLRWQRDGALVPPDQFIPLAEETGLIVPMGEFVLRAACRQTALWQRRGLPGLTLAVNLSARQFLQHDLLGTVENALRHSGLDPRHLELEMTESTVLANLNQAVDTMRGLNAMGVRLSLDDFGTGYSSLSYLRRLPIDALKIDKSFIHDIPHQGDDMAITRAVISLAHSLGLKVIAEGVETLDQLGFLRQHGCDIMQGFLFSRPLPPDQLLARLLADPKLG